MSPADFDDLLAWTATSTLSSQAALPQSLEHDTLSPQSGRQTINSRTLRKATYPCLLISEAIQ